jgi:hypothetical protein
MNERRQISFLLTVEDHIEFNRLGLWRLPFVQRNLSRLLLGGAFLILIFLLFKMALIPGDDGPAILFAWAMGVFPLFAGLALLAHPSQIPRRVRAMLAKPENRHLVGEKTLHIGPEGVTLESRDIQTLIPWNKVEEIEETDDYVFFFYLQRTAFILPRRPFPTEEDYEEFMNLARRYYEELESVPPPRSESVIPQPTRDREFASGTGRAYEPPTVLRDAAERTVAGRNLSFVLTVEDYIAFNNLLHQRLPYWLRHFASLLMIGIVSTIVGFLLLTTAVASRAPADEALGIYELLIVASLVLAAVLPLFMLFMMRSQATKRAQAVRTLLAHPQNQKLVGEMTISITPEEVISKSMMGTTSLSWDRIVEIVVTANHAFFFSGERNAITIPKRPRQAEEFEEFVDLARQYHEDSLS